MVTQPHTFQPKTAQLAQSGNTICSNKTTEPLRPISPLLDYVLRLSFFSFFFYLRQAVLIIMSPLSFEANVTNVLHGMQFGKSSLLSQENID